MVASLLEGIEVSFLQAGFVVEEAQVTYRLCMTCKNSEPLSGSVEITRTMTVAAYRVLLPCLGFSYEYHVAFDQPPLKMAVIKTL